MKPSAAILFSLLMLPLLTGCAAEAPTSEQESITGAILEMIPAANDCEEACANYVNKCLTLVPNATQELFDEGQVSCMQECEGWEPAKVACMRDALDCESMTNVCEL